MADLRGGTTINGYVASHAGNLLGMIKDVDGPSSGIDAQYLGGKQASEFAAVSHGVHLQAPQAVNDKVYLRNDNTWQTITPAKIGASEVSHSHGNFSRGTSGMVPGAPVGTGTTKFLREDGSWTDTYTHPSGDGNLHVPVTGIEHDGKFLMAGPTPGSLSWDFPPIQEYFAGAGITMSGTTFSHTDTSEQASVSNADGKVIQSVTLDTYGHVTGASSLDMDIRYYTQEAIDTSNADLYRQINEIRDLSLITAKDLLIKADNSMITEIGTDLSDVKNRITALEGSFTVEITEIAKDIQGNINDMATVKSFMKFDPDGLVIGKSNSDMNVTVTNTELQFWDNSVKVAYISGQIMNIDNLDVDESLIVGAHKISKYNDDITIVQWVGVN